LPEWQTEVTDQFVAEEELRYYNGEVHAAAFALPNDIKALLGKKKEVRREKREERRE
jgi:spermidine synthase